MGENSDQKRAARFAGSPVILSAVLALVILRGWLQPLPSGLSLDEMGTHYVVSGTWAEFVERMSRTIQSPLYCAVLWLWTRVAGLSEWALRFPSILCLAGCTYPVYRMAARLCDRSAGMLAVLAFCAMVSSTRTGIQARPYALGMLLAAAAMLFLWDWLIVRSTKNAWKAGLLLALLLYVQPLNAALLVAAGAIAASYHVFHERLSFRQCLLILGSVAAIAVPVTPYYWAAVKESSVYTWAARPAAIDFALIHVRAVLPGCLLLGLLAASLMGGRISLMRVRLHDFSIPFLTVWTTVPPLVLFVSSRWSNSVFVERYYSTALPAAAIFLALAVRQFEGAAVRHVIVCVFSLGSILATWGTDAKLTMWEWREAAHMLRSQSYDRETTPILVRSGFTEAKDARRLQDPLYREFILAPVHVYPVPGLVRALPDRPDDGVRPYLESLLAETAHRHRRLFILAEGDWHQWFRQRFPSGWDFKQLHPFVTEMTRK